MTYQLFVRHVVVLTIGVSRPPPRWHQTHWQTLRHTAPSPHICQFQDVTRRNGTPRVVVDGRSWTIGNRSLIVIGQTWNRRWQSTPGAKLYDELQIGMSKLPLLCDVFSIILPMRKIKRKAQIIVYLHLSFRHFIPSDHTDSFIDMGIILYHEYKGYFRIVYSSVIPYVYKLATCLKSK